MLGDMLGDLQKKQDELKTQLKSIEIKESISDGAVIVTANAAREITNIELDESKIDLTDKTAIEDLILVAVNNALTRGGEKEAEMSQSLVSSMLPPGMENMLGL